MLMLEQLFSGYIIQRGNKYSMDIAQMMLLAFYRYNSRMDAGF
jgi:hypothetical protein